MKQFKNIMIAGGVLLTAFASCKKENLDKVPYSAIALSESFQTVKDAKTWNLGLYASLRARVNGIYMFSTDVQADQLNASLDYGNRNGSPHRWDFTSDDYTLRDVWSGYYSGLTNANIQIKNLPTITPVGDLETGDLARYKADAYMVRAYYYSKLEELFAKPYEPATASSDLGVPLVLEYDVTAQPARATNKQVYDQILADLTQALTLYADAQTAYAKVTAASPSTTVPNILGSQGAPHFTIDAAKALEARVRLYMQDWAGAKAAADVVIASGRYPLITTAAAFANYWYTDTKTESILQLNTTAPSELANTNSIYLGLIPSTGRYTPDFIPSQWVVDKYDPADIRKGVYFAQKPLTIQGSAYNNIWLVNKYPGNPALFTGATTNYQHAPKVLRIAELYLISAEAGARGTAAADGLVKLNALRTARGLPALTGLSGTALFDAVKDERFRELAFEGFRLMDLKRWHEPVVRHDPQNTAMLTSGANYYNFTVAADNPKFVWGIPSNDISINKNLNQNQGW